MNDLKSSLVALIKVKTIVTVAVITVFCILALKGALQPEVITNVVTMVVAFYFGIQKENKG